MEADPPHPENRAYIIDTRPMPNLEDLWRQADDAAQHDGGQAVYLPRTEPIYDDATVYVLGKRRTVVRHFVNWRHTNGGSIAIVKPPSQAGKP